MVQLACIASLSFALTSCKEPTKLVVMGHDWGPISLQQLLKVEQAMGDKQLVALSNNMCQDTCWRP